MSFISDIFSSGVSAVVDSVGKVIDNVHTSDEEKDTLKLALNKELNNFKAKQLEAQAKHDAEITKR